MKFIVFILILLISVSSLNRGEVYKKETIVITQPKKASFIIAYSKLRRWEGNYVNDPDDFGLETYGGVTRRYNPKWYGWRHIHAKKDKKWNDSIPEAEFWTMDYYLTIWVREGFYNLENQDVANYLFDIRIHLYKNSVKLINETYGYNYRLNNNWVDTRLDSIDLCYLQERRKRFYLELIRRKPHYKKFKKNWLRRAEYI